MGDVSISVDGNYAQGKIMINSQNAKITEYGDSAASDAIAADLAVLESAVTVLQNSTVDADARATLQAALDGVKANIYANPGASSGPLYCNLEILGNFSIQNMCKVEVMDPSLVEITNSLNLLKAYVGFYLGKYNNDTSDNKILNQSWKDFQKFTDLYFGNNINMWYQSFLKKHGSDYDKLFQDDLQKKYYNASLYGQQCICTNSNPTGCAYSIACNLACGKVPTLHQFVPVNMDKLLTPFIFNQGEMSGMVSTMPFKHGMSDIQNLFINPLSLINSVCKICTLNNTVTLKYHVNSAGLPDPFRPHFGNPTAKQLIESGWLGITEEELAAEQKLVRACYKSDYASAKPYLDLFSDGVKDGSYQYIGPINNETYKNLEINNFKELLSACEDSITLVNLLPIAALFGQFRLDHEATLINMKDHHVDTSGYHLVAGVLEFSGVDVESLPFDDSFWKIYPVYKVELNPNMDLANKMNDYLLADLTTSSDLSNVSGLVNTLKTSVKYSNEWSAAFGALYGTFAAWRNGTSANAVNYRNAMNTLITSMSTFTAKTKISGQEFAGPGRVKYNNLSNYPPSVINLEDGSFNQIEYVYVDVCGNNGIGPSGAWNVGFTPFDNSNQILIWNGNFQLIMDAAENDMGAMGVMMLSMMNIGNGNSPVSAGAWTFIQASDKMLNWLGTDVSTSPILVGTIEAVGLPPIGKYIFAEFGMLTYLTCCMEGTNFASRLGPFARATMSTGCNAPNKLASLEPYYYSIGGKAAIDAGLALPTTFLPRDPNHVDLSNDLIVKKEVTNWSDTHFMEPTGIDFSGVQCIAGVQEIVMMLYPCLDYAAGVSERMIETLTTYTGEGSMMRNRLEQKPELLSYVLTNLFTSASLLKNVPSDYNATVDNKNFFSNSNLFPNPNMTLHELSTTTFTETDLTENNINAGNVYFELN